MAIFYVGPRPVLKGRDSDDSIHTWKGTAGTYSNWSLFNSSHVLDGAPNNDHDPGDGRHPHGVAMSRWFRGLDTVQPLDGAGHADDVRYRPLENKAAGNNLVFKTSYGHVERVSDYNFDEYDESTRTPNLTDPGHAIRDEDSGAAATFGHFGPHEYKGIPTAVLSEGGQTVPVDAQSAYGRNKINEWRGVPSSQILG